MKTRVEDTMAVKESKEVTLHCSIRAYHITIWSTTMENWTCSSAWKSSYVWCGWTLNWHSDDQAHNHCIVAVKKQLGIFLNIFHVLFSVSPRGRHYCNVTTLTIFYKLPNIIVAVLNKHEILITHAADYGWQVYH